MQNTLRCSGSEFFARLLDSPLQGGINLLPDGTRRIKLDVDAAALKQYVAFLRNRGQNQDDRQIDLAFADYVGDAAYHQSIVDGPNNVVTVKYTRKWPPPGINSVESEGNVLSDPCPICQKDTSYCCNIDGLIQLANHMAMHKYRMLIPDLTFMRPISQHVHQGVVFVSERVS